MRGQTAPKPHTVATPAYLIAIFTSVSKQVLNTDQQPHSVLLAATTSYTAPYATTRRSGLLAGTRFSQDLLLIGNQKGIFVFVRTAASNVAPGRLTFVKVRKSLAFKP